MKAIDTKYQAPSEGKLVHHDLPQPQQKIQDELQVALSQTQWIALIFDMWTSNTSMPYIGLTAVFLDSVLALCTRSIGCAAHWTKQWRRRINHAE